MFGINRCKGVFLENALQARVGSIVLVGGLYERLALSLFLCSGLMYGPGRVLACVAVIQATKAAFPRCLPLQIRNVALSAPKGKNAPEKFSERAYIVWHSLI